MDPDHGIDAWEAIETAYDDRVEAWTLFLAARCAHEHAMNEMARAQNALVDAQRRAEASRAHGARAGALLTDAIRLIETRRAA